MNLFFTIGNSILLLIMVVNFCLQIYMFRRTMKDVKMYENDSYIENSGLAYNKYFKFNNKGEDVYVRIQSNKKLNIEENKDKFNISIPEAQLITECEYVKEFILRSTNE